MEGAAARSLSAAGAVQAGLCTVLRARQHIWGASAEAAKLPALASRGPAPPLVGGGKCTAALARVMARSGGLLQEPRAAD
jgi:hypothetical protein